MIAASMYSDYAGIISKTAVLVVLAAAPNASAQESDFRFELAPIAGVTSGGEFADAESGVELSLGDSSHVGLILDIRESPNTQWEVLYSRQATEADVAATPLAVSVLDLDVHYLQGGGTYQFGGENARPFISATIGASHFDPGLSSIDSETFLSFSIGAGLQLFPTGRFGMRLEARGFGTLLESNTDLFCESGPAGAVCAIRAEGTMLWQLQAFAGLVFRF
jgi:hypothetical protein